MGSRRGSMGVDGGRRGHGSKRVVLCTFGSPGDLLPFLAIGRELRTLGHEVVIATSATYRDRAEGLGLAFAPVRPDRPPGIPDPDLTVRVSRRRSFPGDEFRAMFFPSLQESAEDLRGVIAGADLVVSHTLAWAAGPVATALGVPWASAVLQPLGYFSRFDPPALGPLPPLPGGSPAAWAARTAGSYLLRRWSAPWNQLRVDLGLPPLAADPVLTGQHAPELALALFSRLLGGPQPDWPAAAVVTGFPFLDDPAAPAAAVELAGFLAAGDPPIVFTLGMTAVWEAGRFYEESVRAAERLGRRAVLLTGTAPHNRPRRLPASVLAVSYAPHSYLFPRAAAIVHSGGIGTTAQALRAGKPMVVVPYAHDQPDNAVRAERLGVARRMKWNRYSATTLAPALATVLSDHVVSRAATVGQAVRAEDGAKVAARALLRLLV